MRIVMSGYVGKAKTGIGRTVENILLNMPLQENDELHLYCNYDFEDFDFSRFCPRIITHRYKISKNSPLLNLLWHQLIYPLKTLKGDVSFIPNVTLLICKFRPTVVMIHDLIEFNIPQKFAWYRMLYRKIAVPITAKRADKIITVSHNSKNDIVKFLKVKPHKIIVSYNGVDNKFRPLDPHLIHKVRVKYNLPEKYVLFVGTIDHPGKNVYSLIQACNKLWKEKGNIFKLVLVGQKGHGYKIVEKIIKEQALSEQILHIGYVKDEDLPAIYNGAFLFAFLSLYEGFGLPILEAMACGTPVVVSNRSSLPELVGEAGLIVDPFDIEGISEAIESILNSEALRKELIAKGLERVKLFSWKNAGEKVYKILKNFGQKTAAA